MGTDEQQIRALVKEWHAATRAGKLEMVLNLMTDDVIFLVPGREPMRREEFASLSRVPVGSIPPTIEANSDIMEIQVSGDMAFMWTRLSVLVTPPSGSKVARAGHTLTVLRRVNGRWLVARDANLLSASGPP
jgi:uncharacterized protein (TIGR02246 family)